MCHQRMAERAFRTPAPSISLSSGRLVKGGWVISPITHHLPLVPGEPQSTSKESLSAKGKLLLMVNLSLIQRHKLSPKLTETEPLLYISILSPMSSQSQLFRDCNNLRAIITSHFLFLDSCHQPLPKCVCAMNAPFLPGPSSLQPQCLTCVTKTPMLHRFLEISEEGDHTL